MKKVRKALAVAALLTVPMLALAQVVANDGSSTRQQTSGQAVGGFTRADTTFRVITMDGSGNLKVVDADRDRDNYVLGQAVVGDTTGTGGAVALAGLAIAAWSAESTSIIPTYNYRRFALGLRLIPSVGSAADTNEVRYAVQVRAHSAASYDTSSSFVWHRWPVGGVRTASDVDSLGQINNNIGVSANGYDQPFSGEFIVVLSKKRGRGNTGRAQEFGGPDGVFIVLTGVRGEQFWAPYTSIRIRNLSGGTGASANRIRVDFMMGS